MPPESPATDQGADRLILRGAFSTAFGFVIRLGARFLFLLVAGRLFGAALFGAYSLAVAVLEASVALTGLSLKKTLFQQLDRNTGSGPDHRVPAAHIVIDAAILVLAASVAVAAAIMGVVAVLPRSVLAPDTATALFWIAPMIAGQALADILFAATRWTHVVRHEVIGRSIVEPYSLLIGAVIAYAAGFTGTGLIIGYWVGNIVLNGYALIAVRRCFPRFELARYRGGRLIPALRELLPNTGTDVINGVFTRLDLYLVGIFLGERWAGIYGMAQQLRTPLRHARQAFDSMLVPMVARTLSISGNKATVDALATAARVILAVQLAFLVAIVAAGGPMLELFGHGFSAGYTALILLTLAEAAQGTFGLGDFLFVYLRPKTGLLIMLASFVACVAAAIDFTPRWGIAGAAGAVLLATMVQAGLRRLVLRVQLRVRPPLAPLWPPLLAGAAGLGVAIMVPGGTGAGFAPATFVALAAALGTYGAVLWLSLRLSGQRLAISGFASGGDQHS
ncbi:oligosaccharide flippase family protein [Sphingomonas sp. So64.6b]|uniref:lipopolysaccharide biosynthesis protein n=1 Tax=Sphingomonas sp. So64.6b TaxID=2997354 RepID=UPI00160329EF|nr:polysaccharide biosynthesis C-terminal domain-containing protein [Sphingomonas sp. So64.6b]QNA85244.1 oligosaccharide flippase family protein [Sphingomonas sp. So64.6b]